jgi:tRNA(Ile)-lysidine synthase
MIERIFYMKLTGSHHTVISAVQTFIKKRRLLRPGQTVIVAVSGGIDSMVLLHLLTELQHLWKLRIVAAHVNYELRGIESEADEELVRKTAKRYGIPLYCKTADTKAIARQQKRSLQETAREIRYSFFETVKQTTGADAIATAHHADDNTETMFINVIRGSGIDGLAGIPVHRGAVIRPLLCLTRAQITQYAKEMKVQYREDASNRSDDYTRNFLRNRIIPKLKERINPSLHETMLHEAEMFRSAADFIDTEAETAFRASVKDAAVSVRAVSRFHPFIRQAVFHRLLNKLTIEPSSAGITALTELLELQKGSVVELHADWSAERTADAVVIRKNTGSGSFVYTLDTPGSVKTDAFTLTVKKSSVPGNKLTSGPSNEYIDASTVAFPLTVRSWAPGDRFIPLGMKGTKKLSDFLGELKLSAEEKMHVPVLESGGRIVWVAGKRLDERHKLTDSTTAAFKLTVQFHGKKNGHR